MAQGTISRLADRGFGFIQQEQGKEDLFIHSSVLQGVVFEDLRKGDRVEFETEPDTRGRGMRAANVRKSDG